MPYAGYSRENVRLKMLTVIFATNTLAVEQQEQVQNGGQISCPHSLFAELLLETVT